MLSLLALIAMTAPRMPHALHDYLAKKDSSFAYRVVSQGDAETTLELTSQTWHGIAWKHTILLRRPKEPIANDTAVLFITGDGPKRGDYTALTMATTLGRLPVAMLFDVPNQPIWGHREDDLIATTFEKYLDTGDPTWPALFPMTKSAIRAMDVVQKTMPNIKRFVVTGASKRGWTTWMVGASGDKRVVAIAPMVIDNLNIPAQMKHQIELWGQYSPMIKDYTVRGLQKEIENPRGRELVSIVDPYSYRANVKMPTLIVKGANDPYWTPDALSMYWNDLHQPKWVTTVPNAGHDLGDGIQAISAIGAFARAAATGHRLPTQSWKFAFRVPDREGGSGAEAVAHFGSSGAPLHEVVVWEAEAQGGHWDIASAKWRPIASMSLGDTVEAKGLIKFRLPAPGQCALFAEFRYRDGRQSYSLCTPTALAAPY